MQLFDSHCHLDDAAFDADRPAVVAECRRQGLHGILVPAVAAASWPRLRQVVAEYDLLHPAVGLHPIYIDEHRDEHLAELEAEIERQRPVAVGEIGLDFFLKDLDVDRQLRFFKAQIAIAANAKLPVVIHCRKAHDEVLAALRRQPGLVGGTAHAFNGSLQQARQYMELGFKLGFGGAMTYERARKLRRLAAELPIEALVLETDAPDMAPAAHHGERNSPVYLGEILQALAALRDVDAAELARQTSQNAGAVFRLNG